jgi:hypothetical protein
MRTVAVVRCRVVHPGHDQRQRQVDIERLLLGAHAPLEPPVPRHITGIRVNRRTIGHHPAAAHDRHDTVAHGLGIELQLGKPESVRDMRLQPHTDSSLAYPLGMLKMLGLQKHPLGPEHSSRFRHGPIPPVRSGYGEPRRNRLRSPKIT